jgi:hypothetical protein
MLLAWTLCIIESVPVLAVFPLLRAHRPGATRWAAFAAVIGLVPLILRGALWPSVHTIAALIALPALLIWLAAWVRPAVLQRRVVRWYGIASLGLSMVSAVYQASWIANCPELTFVVPHGFKGTISLIKDSKAGIDLKAIHYRVAIPATAEVRIRDDRFLFRCYTAKVRLASGIELPFEDGGVVTGAEPGPDPQKFSTDFDGTRHQWIVK